MPECVDVMLHDVKRPLFRDEKNINIDLRFQINKKTNRIKIKTTHRGWRDLETELKTINIYNNKQI